MSAFSVRALLVAAFSSAPACIPHSMTPSGDDLFRLAVTEAPGGAFTSVWTPGAGRAAWISGGYIDVDRALVPDQMAGRLVRYEDGRFETVCRTPHALWWVHGIEGGPIFAAGAEGSFVRYTPAEGCVSLDPPIDGGPRPTFWGIAGDSASDLEIVGGAPSADAAYFLRFDGARFTRLDVPEHARGEKLYKVARSPDRSFVVGTGGTVFHWSNQTRRFESDAVPALGDDDALFTVSCAPGSGVCAAVGGRVEARILLRPPGTADWVRSFSIAGLPGLNGVFVQDEQSFFMVGQLGTTLHYNGRGYYRPPDVLTADTLHAVNGNSQIVVAVGGEIGHPTADQRGTILIRGEGHESFLFDGVTYQASGEPRPVLGGGGGQ